jgi:NAD(P)-dependent dehydrogenase (short-subunit alcohol dehydrogenase family)
VVVFANAGLGLETTRTLVSTGARVIIPARNLHKAKAALAGPSSSHATKRGKLFSNPNNTSTGSHNSTIRNIFIQQNNYPNFFSGITAI